MDTQLASKFLSDALDKHGHNVPADMLHSILAELDIVLENDNYIQLIESQHALKHEEEAIQARVNELRNVNCDEESLMTVLMGLNDQQRDAVLAALGAEG